jgi:hypothetical protein
MMSADIPGSRRKPDEDLDGRIMQRPSTLNRHLQWSTDERGQRCNNKTRYIETVIAGTHTVLMSTT